jgi:hypothetical protein
MVLGVEAGPLQVDDLDGALVAVHEPHLLDAEAEEALHLEVPIAIPRRGRQDLEHGGGNADVLVLVIREGAGAVAELHRRALGQRLVVLARDEDRHGHAIVSRRSPRRSRGGARGQSRARPESLASWALS